MNAFDTQCGTTKIYLCLKILREIKVGWSIVSKSTTLTHLEALSFEFYEFLHFLRAGINQIRKLRAPEFSKIDFT